MSLKRNVSEYKVQIKNNHIAMLQKMSQMSVRETWKRFRCKHHEARKYKFERGS